MPNVRIPETHFLRTVKLQYSNIHAAIVREVVQNSIDAGASNISLTVAPEGWFSVDDDGQGMTRERMIDALLTFGGSAKGENSIGKFGMAKEAILFAHKRYSIRSRNLVVEGRGIEYELESGEFRQGTLIRIEFHPEYGFDYATFMAAAREVLADSEFSMKVTLNGEVVPGNPKGRTMRVFSWARIHCRKLPNGEQTSYALVRAKGLIMFKQYIGQIDKSVIVEIEADPKEVFTAMRDRLNHRFADEAQKFFNEIVADRRSFDRKSNEPTLIRGDKGAIDELADEPEPTPAGQSAVAAGYCAQQFGFGAGIALASVQTPTISIPAAALRSGFDFIIQFDASKYRRIPKRFEPANMPQRLIRLAQLWKHCLKLVMMSNGVRKRFRIGWILNDDEAALYGKRSDGIPAFLLNPEHRTMPSKRWDWNDLYHHLLVVACHEVAHLERTYHDEDFVNQLQQLMQTTLNSSRGPAWHLRMARQEMV